MCLRAHGCEMLGGGVVTSNLFTVATYNAFRFGIRRFISRFIKSYRSFIIVLVILTYIALRSYRDSYDLS